jgi:hypothetical protein
MCRRWWPGLVVVTATAGHRCLSIDADHCARAVHRERAEAALQLEQADADDRREDHQPKKIDHRCVLLFNPTASTDSKPESSAARSSDDGHGTYLRSGMVGADIMSVLPSPGSAPDLGLSSRTMRT